jgi:signal transduction histidine kinase
MTFSGDRLLSNADSTHLTPVKFGGCATAGAGCSAQQLMQTIQRIRHSLDLNQIWQQTAEGLAVAFNSRCLVYAYPPNAEALSVVACGLPPDLPALVAPANLPAGDLLASAFYISAALNSLEPVVVSDRELDPEALIGAVAVATRYETQPNGLILLYPIASTRWSESEMLALQQVADQAGTAAAHALLLESSRTLVTALEQANDSLMRQQSDLEEARQQAEAASRLKSDFLANTSHELRTPLNGMLGFLKLILDGMVDDPEEQTQFIDEAYRSAMHLLNLINDILDIAKIEAGKMQLDLDPIELDELLGAVENFTRPQAQQKHLGFEIRTPATRDRVVLYGNYQRLLQVMLNLVGNAIKFTHEGSITISAEVIPGKVVVQEEEKPGTVKISVADTGIGVSLDQQDKLFQTFSQVDGSRTRQYGGTGLGLAISQKLVEAMGGVVNFFSMGEGLGSTVTFTVPLYQDPVMVTSLLSDSVDLLL